MHSYISSSNQRCLAGSWLLTWLVGFALAGSVLCAMEFFFRARGHQPSVIDDQLLWAYHRHRIYDDGKKKTIVLLGASRIQLGFVPNVFEQHFPDYRIVQLAIDGSPPFAALRDLANDERFTGIVICCMHASGFLHRQGEGQQPYVDFYHNVYLSEWCIDEKFNRFVSTFLQKNFVIFYPTLRLDRIVNSLIKKRFLPAPYYLITHSDRSRSADYTKLDIVAHRRERIRKSSANQYHPTPENWIDQAMEIEPLVQAIQNRGGQVVFVRYITTDEHYEFDQKYYPKKEYWDQFAKMTSAVTIHFKDVHELSNFNCPDTSHLDFRDAPRFTISLGNELCRLGVIHP